MRGVSRWVSHVAPLLAASLVFGVAAWADEAPLPQTDPPEWRISPPVGVTAQARIEPPVSVTSRVQPPVGATARLQPPGGVTPQARLNPPVGAPTSDHLSLFDMILMWLQPRISIP